MPEFDQLADRYDDTRGGEQRGEEYAEDIDRHLPAGEGPVLEIGVGTGVVALGLRRRGRDVIGLDLSWPMLAKARTRLGTAVILADALEMAVGTSRVAHAVSVWVVHSVADPVRLFTEAVRVIQPGGTYVVCPTQHPMPDDAIGRIITDMTLRVDARGGASRSRAVTADEVMTWAGQAGFSGAVHQFHRRWYSTPAQELEAIRCRAWPAMRKLDEAAVEEVTRPAIDALEALPNRTYRREAVAHMVVLVRP